MNRKLIALGLGSTLSLVGCGGSSGGGDSSPQVGSFSLAVSDAPVDEASEVVLFFNEAVLVPQGGGDPVLIDLSGDGADSVDLLKYQGDNSKALISGQELPTGVYTMCLYVLDGNGQIDLSYVNSESDGIQPLRVNSKGSCSGVSGDTQSAGRIFFNQPFTINAGSNSFVAEFDLRKGLVNPVGQAGYFIKPTAVQLVNLAGAGTITGQLQDEQRLACEADESQRLGASSFQHTAYLYASAPTLEQMGDFIGEASYPEASELQEPIAAADISLDDVTGEYRYTFGFIGEGDYQLGYTCVANADLADSHETQSEGFGIYQSYGPVTVLAEAVVEQNLTLPE